MEGGRVSHSWCMYVVVMAMVGWMGAGMELVFGKRADKARWLVVCRSISRVCGEYTDYTRSYHHPGAQSG